MSNQMTVIRIVERFEVDGTWRTRNLRTEFWVGGRQIEESDARAWVWGADPTPKNDPVPAAPAPEPGLHEIDYEAHSHPVWILMDGYPLSVAAAQSQLNADTMQQPQYIVDHGTADHPSRAWIVFPNPDSPHRSV